MFLLNDFTSYCRSQFMWFLKFLLCSELILLCISLCRVFAVYVKSSRLADNVIILIRICCLCIQNKQNLLAIEIAKYVHDEISFIENIYCFFHLATIQITPYNLIILEIPQIFDRKKHFFNISSEFL